MLPLVLMRNWNPMRLLGQSQRMREVAFALNLVSATAYALLIYGETHGLDYYLLRAAIRVDDILHFSQTSPVTTEALRRNGQNVGALFAGMELTILVSMFAAVMVVLLLLRLSPSAWYRVVMGNRAYGFLALFSFPTNCLCTVFWQAGANDTVVRSLVRLFWLLLALDVFCAAILFLASRVRPFSTWTIGILLALHCAFWVTAMSPPLSLISGAATLSFAIFPFSGARTN